MVSVTVWVVFNAFILAVLLLDLCVFQRKPHEISFKEAFVLTGISISLALLFNIYVYFEMGKELAINFLTGYLVEKSLSLDNLFVILLIFKYFKTPASSLHKVLFWGILGAIITRAIFIFLGLAVAAVFHAIVYIFGLFLIFTGFKLLFQKGIHFHPENNIFVRLLYKYLPMTPDYQEDRFFIVRNSKLFFTPLFLVLIAIESTDILFAIDSIPAILAITFNPFIAYSSNVFAVLGLRSLFFLLAKSIHHFKYLHYGISIILIIVGFKTLVADVWTPNPYWSLVMVSIILLISIVLSVIRKHHV